MDITMYVIYIVYLDIIMYINLLHQVSEIII